jgi:hypothetical protein
MSVNQVTLSFPKLVLYPLVLTAKTKDTINKRVFFNLANVVMLLV